MDNPILINGRRISEARPPYIIAEISANHNGSIEQALETMRVAKLSGIDAVKIQTYTPDTMTIDGDKDDFLIGDGLWKGRTLYELYTEAYTPFEWHERIFNYARELDITLFSSAFDESAVDLLESLAVPAYKVASFELVDLPLISYIAKKKKPILMSTGMASISEVGEAIETAKSNGCDDLVILHCVSSYPAATDQANLSAIQILKNEFNMKVGLSDHTLGNVTSVVATALGAVVIEKHFTLSRRNNGVDSAFSLEPNEMKKLVTETREAYFSLGRGRGLRSKPEETNKIFRRSLYFVEDLKEGDLITEKDIRRIRPGFGLSPKFYDEVVGKRVTKNVERGDRVSPDSYH